MIVRLVFAALVAFAMALPAQASPNEHYVFQGYAIAGTDPVAYFTDGKPTEGSDKFTAEYDGVKWKFASAANRDAFLADPAKYAPQYGGYCVTGMSFGEKVPPDPSQWDIVDGKLYLNSSAGSRGVFMKDEAGTISRADGHWPKVKDTP
jgi:YHS domain-containing protein